MMESEGRCTMGVGCDEFGVCYADVHGQPDRCPASDVPNHLLMKRGLYYAPNRQGYTAIKSQAGRYRQSDALGLDGVTAVHVDDADGYSPACWPETRIIDLERQLSARADEIERLRDALRRSIARLDDMLMGDDGQAWQEARKTMPAIRAVLGDQP